MKKLVCLLLILNIVVIVLIVLKLVNQNQKINYNITDSSMTQEEIEYELTKEIRYGETNYSKYENGKIVNTSEENKKEITIEENFIAKDFTFVYDKNATTIKATIVNNSEEEMGDFFADLVLYNDKDEEIGNYTIFINSVPAMSEGVLSTSVECDVSDVYKCEILKKEVEF